MIDRCHFNVYGFDLVSQLLPKVNRSDEANPRLRLDKHPAILTRFCLKEMAERESVYR